MKHRIVDPRRFTTLLSTLVLLTLILIPGQSSPVLAQAGGETKTYDIQKITPHVFNGDVRNLPPVPSKPKIEVELKEPGNIKQSVSRQGAASPNLILAPMPAPTHNFAGLTSTDSCTGGQCGAGIPPDTNGDVGPSHYIQAVNSAFAIYNKAGTLLASFTEDSLWSGSGGGACDGNSQGDPVVIYDALANRWILTNFAFAFDISGNPVSPFYQCLAVSKTSDPVSGGWYLYAIRTDTGNPGQPPLNTINDYPKFGIWTDCLYYSANGFLVSSPIPSFNGGEFGSFSRSDMYAGLPLTGSLGFAASTSDFFTMIPSNLSAPGAAGVPPAGTPNYFVQESGTAFNYRVRKFTAGANCGAGTLSAVTIVSQTSYTFPDSNIVPQPAPATASNVLDSLGDRMMQKVQYRKVGAKESLWVAHTFRSSVSGPTGTQWAQIDVTGKVVATTPVQQQLYNPGDGVYRWMGSIAADKSGNVALGYSSSGSTSPHFPSIAYAGRLATDPLNNLPQSERVLVAGVGSQVNNCGGFPCHRWGDYSAMSVDPVDGCTFWYTNEYYVSQAHGNVGNWDTRIGSFKFPTCGAGTTAFASQAVPDGRISETGENTNVGGVVNTAATTFVLGDDAARRQYRSVLSFNTASLPDAAVITSVTLKLTRQSITGGGNPFAIFQGLLIDVRKGFFGVSGNLEAADFQAAPSVVGLGPFNPVPVGAVYTITLPASAFTSINKLATNGGVTQLRLRFKLDDNNNAIANFISFYSGDFATPTSRPTLTVAFH